MPRKPKKGEPDIYERCRRILKMPDLPAKEMDEMREHLCLLAQTVCEHLRGKKFRRVVLGFESRDPAIRRQGWPPANRCLSLSGKYGG